MPRPQTLNQAPLEKSSRANLQPTKTAIQAFTDDDIEQEDLLDAMMETHIHGMAQACNQESLELLHKDEFPEMYKPTPGRCLWNWDRLSNLHEQLGIDPPSINALLSQSLRPSIDQEHLAGTTPLGALLSVGGTQAQVVRLSRTLGLHQRTFKSKTPYYFRFQTFGKAHNDAYFRTETDRISYEPPRNSKRTAAQHFALQVGPLKTPLQTIILKAPPVKHELSPVIESLWKKTQAQIMHFKQEIPNNPTPVQRQVFDLAFEDQPPVKVMKRYLMQEPTRWEGVFASENHDANTPYLVLARTMLSMAYNRLACCGLTTLLVSAMSGVSPAVLTRSALEQLRQHGFSYLDEAEIIKMADIIRHDLPEARGARNIQRRDDLLEELEQLSSEAGLIRDELPPSRQEEVRLMQKDPNSLPAWRIFSDFSAED